METNHFFLKLNNMKQVYKSKNSKRVNYKTISETD